MEQYTLKRRYFEHGTFGELFDPEGHKICCTVEREWYNNERGISCVPEGIYVAKPADSPRFGEVYVLESENLGVTHNGPSQRTHILIHKANTPDQLQGCIAPGTDFGIVGGRWAVLNSSKAFIDLMDLFAGLPVKIKIEG